MHIFRKYIIRPVETDSSGGLQNLRLLLDSVCLRRTKELLNLSEPIEKYHMVDLSAAENRRYNKIGEDSRIAIDRAVCGHDTANAYSSVLQALVGLRLLCNNGTFERIPVDNIKTEEPQSISELSVLLQQGDQTVHAHDSEDALFMGESDVPDPNQLVISHSLICPDSFGDTPEDSQQDLENGPEYYVEEQFPGDVQSRKHPLPVPNSNPTTPNITGGYSAKLSAVVSELEESAMGDKRSALQY